MYAAIMCCHMAHRKESALSDNTVLVRIALLVHLLAGQTPRPHAVPLKAGTGYISQVQAQDAPACSALLRNQAGMLMLCAHKRVQSA